MRAEPAQGDGGEGEGWELSPKGGRRAQERVQELQRAWSQTEGWHT